MPTESIEEYVLVLRKLGSICQFKDLDDQLKEKLIDGVNSKLIKFELLKTMPKTLEETVRVARTVEAALLQTTNKTEPSTEIFQYQQFKGKKPKPSKVVKDKKVTCYCCGNDNHIKSECRLINKFCSECGKQGHLFKVCPKKTRQAYVVQQEELEQEQERNNSQDQDDVEESVGQLFDEYAVNVSRIPPHYVTLEVEGMKLDFQLDTGSDVTVIPLRDQIQFFENKTIHKCAVKFKNFDQTISQPIGMLKELKVQYKQSEKKLNVYVAQDNVPRILGRDWLDAFDLWPPMFINTNVTNQDLDNKHCVKTVSDAEHVIKERFAEVFSPQWGEFKGDPIELKLKPDAKPKCLPARRIPYAMKDKVKSEISRLL